MPSPVQTTMGNIRHDSPLIGGNPPGYTTNKYLDSPRGSIERHSADLVPEPIVTVAIHLSTNEIVGRPLRVAYNTGLDIHVAGGGQASKE